MTSPLYDRVPLPNGYEFQENANGNLTLSTTATTYTFTPVQPSPPPTGFFLPLPTGWKDVLKTDFTAAGASVSADGDWTYGGKPGGTSNCQWLSSQLSFVQGQGAKITTQWDASLNSWISAGLGTNASYSFPLRIRVYDLVPTANIVGHNKIALLWGGNWKVEVDMDECAINSVGSWSPSITRGHSGSSANQWNPIVQPFGQALGSITCTEVECALVNGAPTVTVWRNGANPQSTAIAESFWADMQSQPAWVGVQDELYSIGSGNKAAIDERFILGIEVLQPA